MKIMPFAFVVTARAWNHFYQSLSNYSGISNKRPGTLIRRTSVENSFSALSGENSFPHLVRKTSGHGSMYYVCISCGPSKFIPPSRVACLKNLDDFFARTYVSIHHRALSCQITASGCQFFELSMMSRYFNQTYYFQLAEAPRDQPWQPGWRKSMIGKYFFWRPEENNPRRSKSLGFIFGWRIPLTIGNMSLSLNPMQCGHLNSKWVII